MDGKNEAPLRQSVQLLEWCLTDCRAGKAHLACFSRCRHNIPIGLHANLSEGSPVCEVLKNNSSLLNEDGFFHGKMGFRMALAKGLLKMSEVREQGMGATHNFLGHPTP